MGFKEAGVAGFEDVEAEGVAEAGAEACDVAGTWGFEDVVAEARAAADAGGCEGVAAAGFEDVCAVDFWAAGLWVHDWIARRAAIEASMTRGI